MRRLAAALAAAVCLAFAGTASAADQVYPAGGWLPAGAAFSWQHPDQGRDFVTNWRGIVQAPGSGCVVEIGHDRPYPNGFGPNFPLVNITEGQFAGHTWYIGHTSALLGAGQCFRFGAPLARADQGHPSDIGISVPGDGGWVELGEEEPSGLLGPFSDTGHWYDSLLAQPLVIRDPYGIFPSTVFGLPYGQHASEAATVSLYEKAACRQPWRRRVCKSSGFHLRLLRDRIWFVAHHSFTAHGWTISPRPRWTADHLGQRFHRIEYDLTH